jgi:hypothetical protein
MTTLDGKSGLRREMVSALNSLFGLLAVVSPLLILWTTYLFDAAGNVGSAALLLIGLSIWSYPLVFLFAWFASRRALQRRTSRGLAVPIALLPAINVAAGVCATVWHWMNCAQRMVC